MKISLVYFRLGLYYQDVLLIKKKIGKQYLFSESEKYVIK